MTTPDVLITGIVNNKEYPLILVEFTEAVTTEDHELQRTYGAIAAYFAGAYYLKLAGEKYSEKNLEEQNTIHFLHLKFSLILLVMKAILLQIGKQRKTINILYNAIRNIRLVRPILKF